MTGTNELNDYFKDLEKQDAFSGVVQITLTPVAVFSTVQFAVQRTFIQSGQLSIEAWVVAAPPVQ